MKNFLNPLLFLSFFNFSLSQLIGSHLDSHNCVSDGGYQWCENTQSCIRPWETPCNKEITNVEFCETSNIQTCRIACQDPECPSGQCAMRIGNCCEHTCVVPPNDDTSMCHPCPPPVPCPMPEISSNCDIIEPTIDHCGCSTGCPTIDCSSSHKVVDDEEPFIPRDCLTWYDGCNSCSVNDGLLEACTMMYCFTTNDPRCTQYLNSDLNQGDICYRFCEDGSQTMIDRSEDCPKDTECMPTNLDMLSFDSCGERANRCIPTNSGH